MKSPCKNCTDRHEACWSTCEKYIKALEDHRKAKAYLAKQVSADGFRVDSVEKARRRRHKK